MMKLERSAWGEMTPRERTKFTAEGGVLEDDNVPTVDSLVAESAADVNAVRRYRKKETPPASREEGDVLRFDGDWVRDSDGSLRVIKKNMRYEKRR